MGFVLWISALIGVFTFIGGILNLFRLTGNAARRHEPEHMPNHGIHYGLQ